MNKIGTTFGHLGHYDVNMAYFCLNYLGSRTVHEKVKSL